MRRVPIEQGKMLYHLTSISNLPGIFEHGLLPRALLGGFDDVADPDILGDRQTFNLDQMVPFHFFARNPFDGCVQTSFPDKEFAVLTVHRSHAASNNWSVIPSHPLSDQRPQVMGYAEGMQAIDWERMEQRNYHDPVCKNICMAECLSPGRVAPEVIFSVNVRTQPLKEHVEMLKRDFGLTFHVDHAPWCFVGRK